MLYQYSHLQETDLKAIQALEAEVGTPLVAYEKIEPEFARLDRDKLAKIQKLEEELGVLLLAQQG